MRVAAYYNEIDTLKAEILREAIRANAIAPGDVDERSIVDVEPNDLVGYTQCHFFAGGGFWSLALRQAGWHDNRAVWTGSCPCPSFSAAGKGEGFADPRHLWPAWARLIRQCHPTTIFGEQVSAAIGHGWLDLVQTDLEAQEYAVGKAVLGACSVGAPHIRQRLYFTATCATCGGANGGFAAECVADAADTRRQAAGQYRSRQPFLSARPEQCGDTDRLAESASERYDRRRTSETCARFEETKWDRTILEPERLRDAGELEHATQRGLGMCGSTSGASGHAAQSSEFGGVGDTDRTGTARHRPDSGEGATARGLWSGSGDSGVLGGVGDTSGTGLEGREQPSSCNGDGYGANAHGSVSQSSETSGGLADADGGNPCTEREQRSGEQRQQPQDGGISELADAKADGPEMREYPNGELHRKRPDKVYATGGVADAELPEWWQGAIGCSDDEPAQAGWNESTGGARERSAIERPGPLNGFWRGADWIGCRDGKFRPVESGTQPLAHGCAARVGRLRLYGDAICVPAAQAFIESYLETERMSDEGHTK